MEANASGYINKDQYPGMDNKPILSPNPASLTGAKEIQEYSNILEEKSNKSSKKGIVIASSIATALVAGGIGLLYSCDQNVTPPTPDKTPQPIQPTPRPTASPEPSQSPEPTKAPFTPTAVATEVPQPAFDYNVFAYDQVAMTAGDYRWKLIEAKELEVYPDMMNKPNLKNDAINAATELSLAHDKKLPSEAWVEEIGKTFSMPGKDILDIEKACLQGKEIPIAPELTSKVCKEVIITSGANLDKDNNKKDKAYQAAQNLDVIFETVFEAEFNK